MIPIGRGAGAGSFRAALDAADEYDAQLRTDAALGAAWRRCEAALPEGYTFSVGKTVGVISGPYLAITDFGPPRDAFAYAVTPTAALEALAELLESRP